MGSGSKKAKLSKVFVDPRVTEAIMEFLGATEIGRRRYEKEHEAIEEERSDLWGWEEAWEAWEAADS